MNVGKCSECSNEPWPSCGAATNCCFSPYQKTGTMMYPVRGCASHYQPRQERRCDNCGTNLGGIFICKNGGSDPACEAWTPRPVVSHEPASGETQGPQCLTGETDERVKKGENLARWFENRPGGYTCKGQPTIDSAVIVTALRGLLAVVHERRQQYSHDVGCSDALFKGIEEMRAERDEYFAERNKFATESSRLQIERGKMEHALAASRIDINDKRDAIRGLERELDDTRAARDAARSRVKELEAKRGKVVAQVQTTDAPADGDTASE